ncbi:MAG: hypothetical protein COW05_08865, partial [Gammaproteobacteria bacterium CG12_big_fil_rev_8_21_14_0_65_46_12]
QSVDYNDGYYTNNATVSGPLTIDADQLSQLSVVYTQPGGTPQTATLLKNSSVGGTGSDVISLSGLVLSGKVPSSAPAGQYTITASPRNTVGPANSPVSYSFQVKGAPIYKAAPTPASQNKNGGDALTTVSFTN